jgi:hypothetical protein
MRITTQLVSALVLASLGNLAMAQEGVQDSTWMTPSTQSRAAVLAARPVSAPGGEASFTVAPSVSGSLTRTQVLAEAREAMRLGLIPVQEGNTRVATAAENEQIRLAGQRALNAASQLAAK